MKKENKKYFVSLAMLVPCNYEIEVEAQNEKEALKKAVEELSNAVDWENLTEPDYSEAKEDFNVKKDEGIYIEEL